MRCAQCHAPVADDDRFCGDCGGPLEIVCPSCGEPVAAGKRFCRACGSAVLANAAVSSAAAPMSVNPGAEPVAERRVCSVLFCDVVGFTPLSEARDPEAIRELLSQYFAMVRTVISRYGGVVEKFIGDAVMAVWGTPVATEGDAERAVRAALDLVAAVAELGQDADVPGLAARAGVVTGEVAVTLGAVHEGMVAGDAVNTAARIQSAAAPGQVFTDGPTYRLAGSAVGFTDAGEHVLKGKAGPGHLWRATRVLSAVGGVQRVDGLEAPLTGRDAELRTVRELFHATADRQVPRLVLVSGPAGVGKSRLGWEFEKYADGLAVELWWHRGRCLSYGEGVAFWALAEIVRQRLGIAEEDPAEVAAAKLAEGLDQFVTDQAERAYVGARLGRLLGVAFAGDSGAALGRDELFAGWRLFFERLAATRPVVLLVEDAQYADSGLLDFLDHLTDWVRDLPVYLLVFARPELSQVRPGFGAGRNRITLTLDPLDRASMDRLADALVPEMPPAARAKITSQAQGIPLFAVETVRSLIDRDIVQPVEGVYRLTGDIGELAVPDSLHALLAARLDALDPAARRLVADAAVLGSTFPAEALIAVSGQEPTAARAALAELLRREVLTVSADPLSPERGSYQFAQQMLRQVAYDTLARRDRKSRHLAVAAHLRAAFPGDGEEVTDVIARHYLDALHAVPGDRDTAQIRGQALAALVQAAERAKRTGAPARAAASYAAAAELVSPETAASGDLGGGPDAGALWENAADAAVDSGGHYAEAIEYAGRARDYYTGHGQARAAARAQAIAAGALRRLGRLTEARDQFTAALGVLRTDPGPDTVRALRQLAGLEAFTGSADAERLTVEALTLGQALAVDVSQMCALFESRAIYLAFTERPLEAAAYLRESIRLATEAGDTFSIGAGLLNLATVLTGWEARADASRDAAGYLRRVGNVDFLSYAIGNLAESLMGLGDWDAAEAEIKQAIDSGELPETEPALRLALMAAMRGDAVAAEGILATLPDLRASEEPQSQAAVSGVEAMVAAARGAPEEALRCARQSFVHLDAIGFSSMEWTWALAVRAAFELADHAAVRELLTMLDSRPPGHVPSMLRPERDLARARLAVAAGDQAAGPLFASAISGLRELSTPYHLAHGLLDQAGYLTGLQDATGPANAPGLDNTAAQAIDEAQAIGRRLRCQPLLDRAAALKPTTAVASAGGIRA
jgi:class 3 adenylate cyclase/tetratricopeptide (TPR) repeat protein